MNLNQTVSDSELEDDDVLDDRDGVIVMSLNDWMPKFLPSSLADLERWNVYQTCHCTSSNIAADDEDNANNISIVEACCIQYYSQLNSNSKSKSSASNSKSNNSSKMTADELAFLDEPDADDSDAESQDFDIDPEDLKNRAVAAPDTQTSASDAFKIARTETLRLVLEFESKYDENEDYVPVCHAIYQKMNNLDNSSNGSNLNSKWKQIYLKTDGNGKNVIVDDSIDLVCKSDELNESEAFDLALLLEPLSKKQLIKCIVNYFKDKLQESKNNNNNNNVNKKKSFKGVLKELVGNDKNSNEMEFGVNVFNFLKGGQQVEEMSETDLMKCIEKTLMLQCDAKYVKEHEDFQTFSKQDLEIFCMRIVCLDESIIAQFEQYMESDLSEMCDEFEASLKMGILDDICDELMEIIKTMRSLNEMKKLFVIWKNLIKITNKFIQHLCIASSDNMNNNNNNSNDSNNEQAETFEYYDKSELLAHGKLSFLMQNLESIWDDSIVKMNKLKNEESMKEKFERFNQIYDKMNSWKKKLTPILGPIFSDNVRSLNAILKKMNQSVDNAKQTEDKNNHDHTAKTGQKRKNSDDTVLPPKKRQKV